MLKKSFRNRSVKSINALLCASALAMGVGFSQSAQASEPFIAEIIMFGGNFAPRGWALCDGQLLPISSNTALFSILGTTYGGDGRTTFGLPDLRGRTAVHPGNGPGLPSVSLGQKGGATTATLSIANMPSHNHTATLHASDERGNTAVPHEIIPATTTDPQVDINSMLASKPRTNIYHEDPPAVSIGDMDARSITLSNTGGGQSFNIRDPYLGINHIIALFGIFPSRN